jgi:hypothetical protein
MTLIKKTDAYVNSRKLKNEEKREKEEEKREKEEEKKVERNVFSCGTIGYIKKN